MPVPQKYLAWLLSSVHGRFRRMRFDLDYTDRLFTISWNTASFPAPLKFNMQMADLGFRRIEISGAVADRV